MTLSLISETRVLKGFMCMIPSISATAYNHICHITDVQEGLLGEWLQSSFCKDGLTHATAAAVGLLLFMTVSNNFNIKLWFKMPLSNHDHCMLGWPVHHHFLDVCGDVTQFEVIL